jgi:glycogen debranching enzyme
MPAETAVHRFPSEASPEGPFYIAATQAVGRPRRTLKDGDTFAVLDSYGDITTTPGVPNGLFYQDTRYLSHLELRINEKRPLLLGSNIRDDNSALFVDLTNPHFILGQQVVLEKDTVHILRTIFLWPIPRINALEYTIMETRRSTFAYPYYLTTTLPTCSKYVDRTANVVVSPRQSFEAMTKSC